MSDRPDVSVVLPGVPWQELARRYEVALREARYVIANGAGGDVTVNRPGQMWMDRLEYVAFLDGILATPLAPAPSASTAPTPLCAHGINHSGTRHGCDGCCKPAPPSSAGEATIAETACAFCGTVPCQCEFLVNAYSRERALKAQLATARAEVERLTRERDCGTEQADRARRELSRIGC